MKKKSLCIIAYLLCIVSCTTDTTTQNSDYENAQANIEFVPQNSTNIYNTKTKQYNEIINSYRAKYGFPETVEELTSQLKAVQDIINKQPENNNISVTDIIVTDILKNPQDKLKQMMQEKNISFAAQKCLDDLISILLEKSGHKQANVEDSITAYEIRVTENEMLDEEDKRVILSFFPVSQFLIATESDRKDRDWEKAVTNKKAQKIIEERQVSVVTLIVLIDNIITSS